MRRVRIAEQLSREDLGVLAQQRFGIERGAGVVEIDLAARAQRTQVELGLRVRGICRRLPLLEVRTRACAKEATITTSVLLSPEKGSSHYHELRQLEAGAETRAP